MPAPLAATMSQLARTKFMSFKLVVPTNYQPPQTDLHKKHFAIAIPDDEKVTEPGSPPLFLPASLSKLHTDSQKMHIAMTGEFLDTASQAICNAWQTWQSSATMAGIIVAGPVATGGQLIGPPWAPMIVQGMTLQPRAPAALKIINVIANVLSTAWLTFTATVNVPGLPWYPLFAAMAGPMGPPTPNIPVPFAALTQVPVSITAPMLTQQMLLQLANPSIPFATELFTSINTAFEQCYNVWKASTMVTNVLGMGPVPSFAPPLVPVGPVVGGVATMAPGGLQ